jgi:hypothetical protein
MGIPITGAFARATQGQVAYANAGKWGNGVNAIHAQYDGPPRPFGPGVPNDLDRRTPPSSANDSVEYGPPWGAPDDPSYLDGALSEEEAIHGVPFNQDGWPDWDQGTDHLRGDTPPDYPAWNENGDFIRNRPEGATDYVGTWQTPNETVSEGWINKGVTGRLEASPENKAGDADPSQVFVQTSEIQRDKGLTQPRTLIRQGPHQDVARSPIEPRKTGPKIKNYSGGERHYDMFPRQIDDIPRPFHFRTAATGPNPYLLSNAFRIVTPMQRTPPPDPSMGIVDSELSSSDTGDYGYTSEEWGY